MRTSSARRAEATSATEQGATARRRRWASGRELDHIEQLASLYRAQLPSSSFLRILPVAVDANVLLTAVTRVARGWTSDLLVAARLGVVRIYAGETVAAEVEEHLPELAPSARVPAAELERIWHAELRPVLRVVDTRGFEHPSLAAILARDPEDRPTAVLSLFIGARLTWSFDQDLSDEGYAEPMNVEIVVAAQKVGKFDLSAHLALNISSESISAAVRAVMRAIERPGHERNVAIVVVLLAAGTLTVALIKDAERAKQTAAHVAQFGVEALHELAKYRIEEGGKLPAILVPATTEPLPVRLAHALAVAPAPLATDELVAVLDATGAMAATTEVDGTLRGYRAFVSGRNGWQLGSW